MGFFDKIFGEGPQSSYEATNPYTDGYLQNLANDQQVIGTGQMELVNALRAQMMGGGPNPAQLQYQANMANNVANAQGLIASQRGLNPALAARMGVNAAAQANNQAALGSALLQQQNQIGAQGQLGGMYDIMQRGNLGYQQNFNTAHGNAQLLNQKTADRNATASGQAIGGLLNSIGGKFSLGMGGSSSAGATQMAGGPMDAGSVSSGAMVAAHGGKVPGKAKVSGDSPKNDTVPARLSPGEIVIPRSKAHDPEKAKAFIDEILKSEKKSKVDYKDVLKARKKAA